jgi:hypothetical protein
MQPAKSINAPSLSRLLVVADWEVDLREVALSCARRSKQREQPIALLVPAWLHGADWVGDPYASVPCARRALTELAALCDSAGLRVESAEVGDPDPGAAIIDAQLSQPVDELMLCVRERRLGSHPFDLAHRIARTTGLSVERVVIARPGGTPHRHAWSPLRRGHCVASEPQVA